MRTRRRFLMHAGAGAFGATAGMCVAENAPGAGPAEKVVLGLIGCGQRGTALLKDFVALPGAEIAYVCDPDEQRARSAAKMVTSAGGEAPKGVNDLRQVLDDQAVDAVDRHPRPLARPGAILACDAGKHVYVEKPCCHNLREGRLMVEAPGAPRRVVQVGTQSRSTAVVPTRSAGCTRARSATVLVAKAWNIQQRQDIGKAQPCEPPPGLDLRPLARPRPVVPYQPNLLHGIWRWWYDFGSGDIGNDGVHDIDVACWGLGVE